MELVAIDRFMRKLWFAYILGFRSAEHVLVTRGACDERVLPPAVSATRPAQVEGIR